MSESVTNAFGALVTTLQDAARENPREWTRIGKFIEATVALQDNFTSGLSATGKEVGPGKKRGRKPKADSGVSETVQDAADAEPAPRSSKRGGGPNL